MKTTRRAALKLWAAVVGLAGGGAAVSATELARRDIGDKLAKGASLEFIPTAEPEPMQMVGMITPLHESVLMVLRSKPDCWWTARRISCELPEQPAVADVEAVAHELGHVGLVYGYGGGFGSGRTSSPLKAWRIAKVKS